MDRNMLEIMAKVYKERFIGLVTPLAVEHMYWTTLNELMFELFIIERKIHRFYTITHRMAPLVVKIVLRDMIEDYPEIKSTFITKPISPLLEYILNMEDLTEIKSIFKENEIVINKVPLEDFPNNQILDKLFDLIYNPIKE